ncbi:MAG: HlyD family efflux transporter periplasmic adaptor subunit, partial [Pseudomonadota bacterium]
MKWWKTLLALPPVLLGAWMISQAISVQPAPPLIEPSERRVPVSFITAEPRVLTPQVFGYGTVEPTRVWTAVPQVAGTIEYLNPAFARGGYVREGALLIRIAAQDAELALNSAEADLSHAQARLDEMQISRQTTAGALEIEHQSLDLAKKDLARTRALVTKGVVSEAVVQDLQRDVLAQRSKVQSLESTLALLPAQLKAQEQTVEKSRIAVDTAALDLLKTQIEAPFDARVASVDVAIGQYVGVGSVMGELDGADTAEIDVQVSQQRMLALSRLSTNFDLPPNEAVASQISPVSATCAEGDDGGSCGLAPGVPRPLTAQVSLTADQGRAQWQADVFRISDTVDPETRSLGVIVRVREPYARSYEIGTPPLIKGMFVKVAFSAPPVSDAVLVPRSAIRNGQVMLAGPDNRLSFMPVSEVFSFGNISVLAPGNLPPTARVITSDLPGAVPGLLLSPQPDLITEAKI